MEISWAPYPLQWTKYSVTRSLFLRTTRLIRILSTRYSSSHVQYNKANANHSVGFFRFDVYISTNLHRGFVVLVLQEQCPPRICPPSRTILSFWSVLLLTAIRTSSSRESQVSTCSNIMYHINIITEAFPQLGKPLRVSMNVFIISRLIMDEWDVLVCCHVFLAKTPRVLF